MEEKVDITEDEEIKKIELFKKCSELCRIVFGGFTAHRWVPTWKNHQSEMGKLSKTFNEGILDIQMIGFVSYQKRDIVPYAQVIKDAYIDLVCTAEFIQTVEIGTYSTNTTKQRMEMWLSKLEEVIGYPSEDPRLFTFEDKQRLFNEKDGNVCSLCNNKIMDIDDAHVDHIKRYSEGGETKMDNAQITHRYCNLSKKLHNDD